MLPVEAGEDLRRAVRDGRCSEQSMVPKRGGCTRGQRPLIKVQPPLQPVNLLNQFLITMTAAYNEFITPAVDDGTDASYAVFGFMQTKPVKTRLMAHVRACIPNAYPHDISIASITYLQYICIQYVYNTYTGRARPQVLSTSSRAPSFRKQTEKK